MPVALKGAAAHTRALARAGGDVVSLTSGALYRDGSKGIVTGYSTAAGGFVAVQHVSGTLEAGLPVEAAARVFDIGLRPDLLVTADVNGDAYGDIVAATRGGGQISVLHGDGNGNFSAAMSFGTDADIVSLAAVADPFTARDWIAVGTCPSSCHVTFYEASGAVRGVAPVPDTPSILVVAPRLNGHNEPDIIAGGASKLIVIDGQTVASGHPHYRVLPVDGALSAAVGDFVYDRRGFWQIAVLANDGSVHIFARQGLDQIFPSADEVQATLHHRSRQPGNPAIVTPENLPWVEAGVQSGVARINGSGTPQILRMRLSGSGEDDMVLLNVNGGHVTTIHYGFGSSADASSHAPALLPARVTQEPVSAGEIVGAVSGRMSSDARMSLITAKAGERPTVSVPTIYRTITVAGTADGAASGACSGAVGSTSCPSLRAAVTEANNDASHNESSGTIDTISLPGGTYSLTIGTGASGNTDGTIHIEIAGPINFVGATGVASGVIITANNNDKIFSNEIQEYDGTAAPYDVFFTNLTLENGYNHNSVNSENPYGGAMDYETDGTGYLTFTGTVLQNNTNPLNGGGAIEVTDDLTAGPGAVEVDSSTLSGNASGQDGGALQNGFNVPAIFNGDMFSANKAEKALSGVSDPSSDGGAYGDEDTTNASIPESTITGCTFTNNTADAIGGGGGAVITGLGLIVKTSTFTGNQATNGTSYGGAIFANTELYATQVLQSTFTGNSAVTGGGALAFDESTFGKTINYNRIVGNSAASGTGLSDGLQGGSTAETVNATDNFWGCNGAATGTGCDTVATGNNQTVTVSPYAQLTGSVSPSSVNYGSTVTMMGGITTDSNSNSLSGNETAFESLSATIAFVQNGNTVGSTTTTTNSSAIASYGITANVPGPGTASIKIDNATAAANYNVVNTPLLTLSAAGSYNATAGTATLESFAVAITYPTGGSAPAGTVTISGSDGVGDTFTASGAVSGCSSGSCSFNVSYTTSTSLPAGTYTLTPSFSDTSGYYSGSANSVTTGTLTIKASQVALSSFTLSPSPVTSAYGATAGISITATATGSNGTPTGTVTFSGYTSYGSLNSTTCVLSSGSCSVTFTPNGTTADGSYSSFITANLPASTNYTAGTATDTLSITAATPGLTVSSISSAYGSTTAQTLTATATASGSGATPTGTVTFSGYTSYGSLNSATCTLSSGACSVTFTPNGTTAVGAYSGAFQGSYNGDGNYGTATASGSLTITAVTPGLSVSSLSYAYGSTTGQTLTATAAAVGSGATPGGTVTFSGTFTSLGSLSSSTCVLSSGSCSVTFTPNGTSAAGNYPGIITASLAANGNYNSATATGNVTISLATPSVILSSITSAYGSTTSQTLTVSLSTAGSGAAPSGAVTFSNYASYGNLSASACMLSNGTCSVTFTPNGTTNAGGYNPAIAASYTGDGNYNPAMGTDTVTITKATASLGLSPNPVMSKLHSTTGITLTAMATGAGAPPTGTVTFSGYASYGSLSSATCVLSAGVCSVTFTPNGTTAVGSYSSFITATLAAGTNYGAAMATDNLSIASPDISFTAVTHNFGSVMDGTTTTGNENFGVQMTNNSASTVTFGAFVLSGSSDFKVATNCGTSLAAGAHCQIQFTFSPVAPGAVSATWSLTGAPNGLTFGPSNGGTLSGTGVATGGVTLTTAKHNFYDQSVGTSSPIFGAVLTNSTSSTVTISVAAPTGNTTDFLTTGFNCGSSLAAGQSCNLQYEFTPKTTGTLTEFIGITANGGATNVTAGGTDVSGLTLVGTGD